MPRYHICNKIRTVADIYDPVTVEGFRLEQFNPGDGVGIGPWTASEDVEADDVSTAVNSFRKRLSRVVDALAIVTRCSFTLSATSFSAYRLTDNPDHVLYFRHLRTRQTVGMALRKPEQFRDIGKLLSIQNTAAIHYFREAMNATSAAARLAMFIASAEALAGQVKVVRHCPNCNHEYTSGRTNDERLAAIMGEDAHRKLYKEKGGSLRHRLLHGNPIVEDVAVELCTSTYENIRSFLRQEIGLESIEQIEAAPRQFESFEWFGTYLRCRTDDIPRLADLERAWQDFGEIIDQLPGY